jgi:hypothetical protein
LLNGSAPERWLRIACALIVVGVVIERMRALVSAQATDFDDAYMFVRYAKHWLAGEGLRWNRGEAPVFGATSLPHVFAVALVMRVARWARIGLDDAGALQVCSRAAAVLLVAGLVATCAAFARDPRLRRAGWLWGALLVPLVAYGEPFGFHAQTGMDTMLAALANTGLLFAALHLARRPSVGRALAAAVVAYAAYLVRPDSAIYAASIAPLCLLLVREPRQGGVAGRAPAGAEKALPARAAGAASGAAADLGAAAEPAMAVESPARHAGRRVLPPLLWFAGAFALLVGVDLLVKARLLGTPFPLGAYVKRPGFYAGFAGEFTWNPFLFLQTFLRGVWPFLVALLVFTRRDSARVVAALLIPVAATFPIFFFAMNQIMGHLGRFYFPALPFLVVAAALSFDRWLIDRGSAVCGELAAARLAAPRAVARLAVAALLLPLGGWALSAAGARYQSRAAVQWLAPLGGYSVSAAQPLPELDSWRSSEEIARLAAAAPPGARLAMSEHGLVGARAPDAVIIDVLGLHDRRFAQRGFSAGELWSRQPDLIWMPHPDHTQMIREILDSDRLWARYTFYPDAFSYGVALLRDGPHSAALARLFRARWEANYPGLAIAEYAARRGDRAPVTP